MVFWDNNTVTSKITFPIKIILSPWGLGVNVQVFQGHKHSDHCGSQVRPSDSQAFSFLFLEGF